jgi:predicted CopG family antitoxin
MVKMASKNIAIAKGAYDLLSNMKLEGESFSDVITRLVKAGGGLSECAGLWGDMSAEALEEVKAGIEGMRRSVDERLRGATIT